MTRLSADTMKTCIRCTAAAFATALFAACGGDAPKVSGPATCSVSLSVSTAPASVPDSSRYDRYFEAAGAEFGVPASLLRSVGYVETSWQMVEGQEEFPGLPAAFGVMALRGERLRTGARLAGVSEEAVRRDATANIRAAAALLRSYGDALGVRGGDVEAWSPAVARFSGIADTEGEASYVRDVNAVRAGHRSMPAAASRSSSDPCGPVVPTAPTPTPTAQTDQAGATWRASPNFNTRQAGEGGKVHAVIIHSCEGAYAGCWSWLANPVSQVSAHYVVREDGAEITQLVREASRGWHIGATYDSTRNAGHGGVLHGVQSNHFTIGVEHGGFASQTSWPVAQIDASAKLVCEVTKRWQIPRDRMHIVSHAQLQPYDRTDPGASWPWADYMTRIDRYCAP